jgi:hypothetical protein
VSQERGGACVPRYGLRTTYSQNDKLALKSDLGLRTTWY